MGRQVGFFALDADLALVLAAAAKVGYLAVDENIGADESPCARAPEHARPSVHGRFFLVPPEANVAELDYGAPPAKPGTRALAWWRTPVIEVIASVQVDKILEPGRVYLPTSTAYTPVEQRFARRYPSLPRVYARLARVVQSWPKLESSRLRLGPIRIVKSPLALASTSVVLQLCPSLGEEVGR